MENGEDERRFAIRLRIENVVVLAAGVTQVFAVGDGVAKDCLARGNLLEAGFELGFVFLRLFYAPGIDRVASDGAKIVGSFAGELVERIGH